MYNLRHRVLQYATAAVLLCGVALAQVGLTEARPAHPDVFGSLHARLNDAANAALALALADKPWMKVQIEVRSSDEPASLTARNTIGRVRAAVERVEQLQPTIEPVLREKGVPSELSALVLIESGGLTTAVSPKGALGLWQLMPDTARRYGLVVSARRDERRDIVKSTHAAAHYLHDLYQQFGDWPLVFAAYNAGEKTVGHAIDHVGERSFLAIEGALPTETRTYVPAILTAIRRMHGHEFGTTTHVVYASAEPGN